MQQGSLIITTGLGLFGLGSVAAALKVQHVAWIAIAIGLLAVIAGLIQVVRGKTPQEKRQDNYRLFVLRNTLNSESRTLNAELVKLQGEMPSLEHFAKVYADHNDGHRGPVQEGNIAVNQARQENIRARQEEIAQELELLEDN
jgi:hypothetical protein